MKPLNRNLFLFFCFTATVAFSQTDTLKSPPDNYFKFNYDNDLFTGTDRYYTQGVYADLIVPFIKKIPTSKILFRLKNSSQNYYGLHLEQDVFTPKEITHKGIWIGERPYSSIFFISSFIKSTNMEKKQRLTSQLALGIIGPDALGEPEQKAIHRATNNDQPIGWENQISQDIVLNYNIKFEQGLFIKKGIEFIGAANARVGTLYDDIGIGGKLRFGWLQNYFQNLGMTKQKGQKKFQCYIIMTGKINAVAYNATLQGGIFDKNSIYTIPDKDVTRLVGSADLGIVLSYKCISIEYSKAYLTSEFKNGLDQSWGHCGVTVCF